MKKPLFVLIIISQLCSIISAQQTDIDSIKYRLDSVVVRASRFEQPVYQIPFSIDVIGPDELSLHRESLSAENVFQNIPGVTVNNRNNLSSGDRIIIRGIGSRSQFGVRGIKIILDGIPLTFADGQSQLNNLDLNSIGKIEVIRGPSSLLYGNSAGGVIYIQSKTVSAVKFNMNPGFSAGSYDFQKFSFSSSGRIGNNSILVNIIRMKYDGFRENSAASSTALNLISKQNFNNGLTLKAVFNFYDAPYLLNPSSLTKADAGNNPSFTREFVKQQGSGKKIRQGQTGVTFSYKPNNDQRFDITAYGISRSMFNPIPGRVIKLNRIAGGFRTNYSTHFSISQIKVRFLSGVDYEFQNDVRTEYANNGLIDYKSLSNEQIVQNIRLGERLLDQNEKVKGFGIFSKFEFSPFEKIYFSLGARYDKYKFKVDDKFLSDGNNSGSIPMDNLSRMVGITYRFNNNLQIFANYSTSFQTPTTSELSNSPENQGGFNSTLNPEQLENFELGARGSLFNNTLIYSTSIYKLIVDQILIPYQLPGSQTDEVFYRNSGIAVNYGFELMLIWVPQYQWDINLSYTFSDFTFEDFVESQWINNNYESFQIGGNRVPGIPKHNISLRISYKSGLGLTSEISLNRTGKFYVNDMNGPEPNMNGNVSDYINDAYFTADFNLVYKYDLRFGDIGVFLGVHNIFNSEYNSSIVPNAAGNRYFEPAAPRNWFGGVSLKIN